MRLIIFCLYLLAFSWNAKAQNCTQIEAYFPLNKGLVYDYNANQVTEFNTEALAILNIKDANLCDNFAVFDVAHYRMKGFATDGYAEDIAAYKKGCAAQKPYYLLFTRKYDENLKLEKIDVEFSLPTEKRFSCLTEMQRSLLKIRLEQLMVEKLKIDKEGYISEFAAIGEFKKQLEKTIDCCDGGSEDCVEDCVYNPQSIFEKISKGRTTFSQMLFIDKDDEFSTTNPSISEKLKISVKDKQQSTSIDLDGFIDNFVSNFSEDIEKRFDFYPTTKIIKYKYPRDCNNLAQSLDDFDGSSAHFTVHVGIINIDNEVGILTITTSANFTPVLSKSFNKGSSQGSSDEVLSDEIDDLKEAKAGKACQDLIGAIFGQGGAYKLKYANDNYFNYRPSVKKVIDDIVEKAENNVKIADANFAPIWAKEHDIMLKFHLKHDDWGPDDESWDKVRANWSANWHICGDAIHSILDACGIIDVPPIGPVCDVTNALLYLSGGDYTNAALSAVAVVPLIGSSATYSKYAGKLWKSIPCFGNKSKAEGLGKCPRGVLTFVVDNATGIIEWCGKRAKLKKLMERASQYSYVWIVNGKTYHYVANLHDAHHVIPWALCDKLGQHPFIKWAAQGGWHPSDPIKNGFPVPFNVHIPDGAKNHNKYNDYVKKALDGLKEKAENQFKNIDNMSDAEIETFGKYCNNEMDKLVQILNGKIAHHIENGIPLNSIK